MTGLLGPLRSFWGRSLRRQLILGIAVVHAVLMTVFVFDLAYRQQSFLHKQEKEHASELATILAMGTVSMVLAHDLAGLAETINVMKTHHDLRYAMILGPNGRVLAHSDRAKVGALVSDPVSLRLSGAEASTQYLIETHDLIDTAAPIRANDRIIGWARIGLGGNHIAESIASLALNGLAYTLLAIAIGIALASFLARGLLRGLRNLTDVANRIRGGERDIRADEDRMDELGELGHGMNSMLEAIEMSAKDLATQNYRFQLLTNGMAQGLCMFDAEQRLIVCNERYASIFALPPDLVRPGVTLRQIRDYRVATGSAPKDKPELFLDKSQFMSTQGKPHQYESDLMDGRTILVHHMPMADGGWVSTLEDITERKRNEEQLRSAEEQLRQAQKMEAIGQLTGGLSHDFNNLLGIVIGNLDLLHTRIVDTPEARELLEEALDASLRGADLNRRLLAFARRQPLQPRNCDLNEVVGSAAKLLGRVLGGHIELTAHAAADLGKVVVDPSQLEAALTNLAVNARDAMPNGGRLTVGTRNVSLDADYASANPGVRPGDYVALEVSDTGSGMSSEVLARAFEPFFTTKDTGKGTGLGLSMVFGFVKQSGGHINIYSEVGAGTTVRIYLPRVEGSSEAADSAPSAPLRRGSETILAVEDNESLRRTLVKQLIELGYTVLEADNGHQALAMVAGEPSIDLMLTDIIMPGGLNGWELARRAGEIRPDLKLLFTSGFPEASFEGGTAIPADARLLGKPYRKSELAEKVREALAA